MKKEITQIKKKMMQSLEELNKKGIVKGDFLCHEDIPEKCPPIADDYFSVVGDDAKVCYIVMIKEIKL